MTDPSGETNSSFYFLNVFTSFECVFPAIYQKYLYFSQSQQTIVCLKIFITLHIWMIIVG